MVCGLCIALRIDYPTYLNVTEEMPVKKMLTKLLPFYCGVAKRIHKEIYDLPN